MIEFASVVVPAGSWVNIPFPFSSPPCASPQKGSRQLIDCYAVPLRQTDGASHISEIN